MTDSEETPKPPSEPQKVRVSAAACPTCGAPPQPRYRPFCSRRCADVDLHRWLSDVYRVPTDEPDFGADPPDD